MPETATRRWRPVSAWDGIAPAPGRIGATAGPAGVTLEPLDHLALATIIVREGQGEAFGAFVSARWSMAPPPAGRAGFGPRGDLVWSAPNQWLAVAREGDALDDLPDGLRGVAAVTQQGDGRAILAVGGPAARTMLAKLVAIDLHPQVFAVGHAAVTAMVHGGVQIWLRDDEPSFVLATPRTSVGSTWTALTAAAAEYGCEVRAPERHD